MVVKITKILTCDVVHSTATNCIHTTIHKTFQNSMIVTVQTHNMHTRLET